MINITISVVYFITLYSYIIGIIISIIIIIYDLWIVNHAREC